MPTIDELLKMTEGVTEKQNALEKLAQTQVTGGSFRNEGQEGYGHLLGKGTPEQTRAMIAMLSNPRQQGQTGIQALGSGFEKGMALRDQLKEKQGNRKVAAAKLGVQGAQDALNNQADIYGMQKDEAAGRAAGEQETYKRRMAGEKIAREEKDKLFGRGIDADKLEYDQNRDRIKDEQWLAEQNAKAAAKNSEIPAYLGKQLTQYDTAANESHVKSRRFSDIAKELETVGGAGWFTSLGEVFHEATGSQDYESELRTAYAGIMASEATRLLPPGPASDKDVKLALGGFPPKNADGEYLASFMRGLAKIEKASAEYNAFASDFVSRNRENVGLGRAWRIHSLPNGMWESYQQDKANGVEGAREDFKKAAGWDPEIGAE